MVRSSLRKTFLKYPTNKNRIDQRNLCVSLLGKDKKKKKILTLKILMIIKQKL